MNVDQVLVTVNNRVHDVYKTLYVSIASYLIIIIGLTVSDAGEVNLICAVLAVAIAVLQIAAGDSAIRDIEALRKDMPKEMQNSNFAESWRSQPFGLFRLLNVIVPIAVSGATLLTIYNKLKINRGGILNTCGLLPTRESHSIMKSSY